MLFSWNRTASSTVPLGSNMRPHSLPYVNVVALPALMLYGMFGLRTNRLLESFPRMTGFPGPY